MTVEASQRVGVYAVVRLDNYLGPETPLQGRVTVKEILSTLEEAEREVARLNVLASNRDVTYFWQYTRYFPAGRNVQEGEAAGSSESDDG